MSGRSGNRSARSRRSGPLLCAAALVVGGISTASAAPVVAPAASQLASTPGHAPVAVFSGAYGVDCPRASGCLAVGAYNANDVITVLTERWDGSAWSVIPSPDPQGATSSVLNAISCRSVSACVAVGSYTDGSDLVRGLAEVWDGSSWALVDTATPSGGTFVELSGISCTGASACVAVGSYTNRRSVSVPLAEFWNGSSWSVVHSPHPTGVRASALSAVSCAGESTCMATGSALGADYVSVTLTELWNGSAWSILASPNPDGAQGSYLDGVSCPTASHCQAVGSYANSDFSPVTLAEFWDGSSWTIVTSPNPTGSPDSALSGVSCASPSSCLAVGRSYSPSFAGKDDTLAESWDGSSWTIVASPSPSTTSHLDGVSCARASNCLAVGLFFNSSGDYQTLAETWNGSSLSIANQDAVLAGVSCADATQCIAVGSSLSSESVSVTLARRWNGTSWKAMRTVDPADSEGSYLEAVTCVSADRCFAVGYYYRLDNTRLTLIESWDGRHWSIVPSPSLPGAAYSVLYGIDCAGPSRCMAVGSAAGLVLAEEWDGAAWSLVPTADPGSSAYSELTGVSCSSGSRCLAVGYETDVLYHADLPVTEAWNGSAWSLVPSAAPGKNFARSSMLRAISCSPVGGCLAVGLHQRRSGSFATFAERWTGQDWVVAGSPSPTGAAFAEFDGISCVRTGPCLAVGNSFDRSGDFVPLTARWTGTSWQTVASTAAGERPSGISYLLDVSCPEPRACLATGARGDPANLNGLSQLWQGSA